MSLYTIASQVIFPAALVKGVIIDAAQIPRWFNRIRPWNYLPNPAQSRRLHDLHFGFDASRSLRTSRYWPMNAPPASTVHFNKGEGKICGQGPECSQVFLEPDLQGEPINPLKRAA